MSDAKKSDVFYGADAIARLDPKKLGELAEASERGYVADEGELPKAIASWHERMRKVLEQGQVAVVTVGDDKEVVSMAGFRLIGKTSDGCPVYEAGSSVTLPEHQKKGYYRQAMERIVAEIQKKAPNAMIVRSTWKSGSKEREKTVKDSCEAMGFQEIPPDQYAKYIGKTWEALSEEERQGYLEWTYYQLDLAQ